MSRFKSTVDILKLLEKSNCRECGLPSCLVFALSVFRGERDISECPRLDPDIARRYGETAKPIPAAGPEAGEESLAQLQKKIEGIDLAAAAERTGGRYAGGRLTLKILGKDFSVDSKGRMSSDIHINPWIAIPVLDYILNCRGLPASGRWVHMRELEDGINWHQFFTQRCEKPMKRVADTYTDFFRDLIQIFNGKPVQNHYQSDVSLVLHPLPRLPLLICYWKPDEGLPSTLNLFFDATADKNLPVESIYRIGAGLTVMFEKLALRHG